MSLEYRCIDVDHLISVSSDARHTRTTPVLPIQHPTYRIASLRMIRRFGQDINPWPAIFTD